MSQVVIGMQKQRGMTLIELMIVLVVIAVLAGIAYPSYLNQVQKSRRADGISALNDAAMIMERCRSDNASYVGCEAGVDATSENGYYTIAATAAATDTTWSFTATAVGTQADDGKCATLTLDSQGIRGSTGSADADTCWGQ